GAGGADGADEDVFHKVEEAWTLVERFGAQLLFDQLHGGPGEHVLERHDAKEIQPFALEAPPRKIGDEIDLVWQHFVEDDADDFDPFALEHGLVQIHLVDRFADAALADDDDFGPENFGDGRVG